MSNLGQDQMFHYLLIVVLSVTACLGFVSFILLDSYTDTVTTQTNVSNAAPSVDTVIFSDSSGGAAAATATLTEDATTTFYVHGTYTDNNGCSQVDDGAGTGAGNGEIKLVLYRSGATGGTACTADNNDCYTTDSDSNCTLTNCTGGTDVTGDFECTVAMEYYADPTDATAPLSAQNWVAYVYADDTSDASGTNTTTTEVASLLALDVTTVINYGTLALGATSSEQSVVVTNTGNLELDFDVQGTSLSCTIGTIAVGQQEHSLSSGFTYGAGTTLTGSNVNVAAAIPQRTNDASASTDNHYWLLQLPASGLSGTCSGTTTYTAA